MTDRRWILSRLALIALVAAPFGLREYDRGLEPYPALLLPRGANTAPRTDNIVTVFRQEPFAETADGSLRPIDVAAMFADMPGSHHPYLVRNDFGISRVTADADRANDYRELSDWLRKGLAASGLHDVRAIVVSTTRLKIGMADGAIRESEVVRSRRLALAN